MRTIFIFACFLPFLSAFAQAKGLAEFWQVRASCSEVFTFSGGKSNYQYGIFELTSQASVKKLARELEVENADQATKMYVHTPASNCSITSDEVQGREYFALLCEGQDGIQSESYVGFSNEQGDWLNSKEPITIAKKNGLIVQKEYRTNCPYCDDYFILKQKVSLSLVSPNKQSVIELKNFDLKCHFNVKIDHDSF